MKSIPDDVLRENDMDTATDGYRRLGALLEELKSSLVGQEENVFSSCSILWASLFTDRRTAEEFNDFVTLLNDSNTGTNGVAWKVSDERKARFASYYKNLVSVEMLDRAPLSMVGTPTIIDFDGRAASTAYLANARLLEEISGKLSASGMRTEGLRVCEIGAGYGGLASLLLASGIAESYTIIDLPENLKLSAYYLTEQYRDRAWRFLSLNTPLSAVNDERGLNFVVPGNIKALDGERFDLVINTDSLGEMPAKTAQAYVAWIAEHLNDGGCFFSKNGHRRGNDSIAKASEFGYARFDARSLTGLSAASSLFDDHSHCILLSKKMGENRNYDPADFDALCALYALGLNGELAEIGDELTGAGLSALHRKFLSDVRKYLDAQSVPGKVASFGEYEGTLDGVVAYLKGLALLTAAQKPAAAGFLRRYLDSATSHISEAMALFALSQIEGISALDRPFTCGGKTRYLVEEVRDYFAYPYPVRAMIWLARNDIIRKKITSAGLYKPSIPHKLKNLYMNLRTRKGFKLERY